MAISPLRQRMIDDMTIRHFGEKTQKDYIRCVKNLAAFIGRPPETATVEDLRLFRLHLGQGPEGPLHHAVAVAARPLARVVAHWQAQGLVVPGSEPYQPHDHAPAEPRLSCGGPAGRDREARFHAYVAA